MKSIVRAWLRTNPAIKGSSLAASALDVTVLALFGMLVRELLRMQSEVRQVSRDDDLVAYIALLIAVCVCVLTFSLWVVVMVQGALFESRKATNTQLRLRGVTPSALRDAYVREALATQVVAIPLGMGLAFVAYRLVAGRVGLATIWVDPLILVAASLVHLVVATACIAWVVGRRVRFDPVAALRDAEHLGAARQLGVGDIVKGALGLACLTPLILDVDPMVRFVPVVGIYLLMDPLKIVTLKIVRRIRGLDLSLASSRTLGNYAKTDAFVSTLATGLMITLGLLGMFGTARDIMRSTVRAHVYFSDLFVYSRANNPLTELEYRARFEAIDPTARIAYGINLEPTDPDGVTTAIFAIDRTYGQFGERMDVTDPDYQTSIERADFDGIYLPSYFATTEDIGKPWAMMINGETIPLRIAGLFDANGSRGRYGFISKAYLQSVIGQPGYVNAFYVNQASPDLRTAIENDPQVVSLFHISKADLENDSYRNAIKGTEIFQLAALFVVVISGIMLVHFYLVNARTNVFDASRMRALGLGPRRPTRVLLAELWLGVTISWLVGLALAAVFAAAGIGLLLTRVSVPINHQFPWVMAAVLYSAMLALGTIALLASTRRARQSSYSVNLSLGE